MFYIWVEIRTFFFLSQVYTCIVREYWIFYSKKYFCSIKGILFLEYVHQSFFTSEVLIKFLLQCRLLCIVNKEIYDRYHKIDINDRWPCCLWRDCQVCRSSSTSFRERNSCRDSSWWAEKNNDLLLPWNNNNGHRASVWMIVISRWIYDIYANFKLNNMK